MRDPYFMVRGLFIKALEMFKSMESKRFLALLLVSFLLVAPAAFGQSSSGSGGNGGMDACSHELLERTIAQKTRPFNPRELPVYTEITHILDVVDQHHPDFGRALRRVFDENWSFGYDGIVDCPAENYYPIGEVKVACQKNGRVILNPDYLDQLDPQTCAKLSKEGDANQELTERLRDILIHEMVLEVALQTSIGWEGMVAMWTELAKRSLDVKDFDRFYTQKSPFFRLYDKDGNPCEPPPQRPLTDKDTQLFVDGIGLANRVTEPASASGPCNPNPGMTKGLRSFDGSCTYHNPQLLVGGEMLNIAEMKEKGAGYRATMAGFCAIQGMKFVDEHPAYCLKNNRIQCYVKSVELDESGHIIDSLQNWQSLAEGGVVNEITCAPRSTP